MNCPKCGYEQEERLDCRKCGIVFSKYLAMQSEGSPSGPNPGGENGAPTEILELRQNVRDLSRRFSEVEFERVERGQIKGELKVLDKRVQAGLDQLSLRLEELEKLLSTPQAPPPIPEDALLARLQKEILEANVDPIARRLVEVEDKFQFLEAELITSKDSLTAEVSGLLESAIEPLAGRLAEAEEKLKRWEKEFIPPKDSVTTEILGRLEVRLTDVEGKLGSLLSAPPGQEPPAGYQDLLTRLNSVSDELAGIKTSAESASALQREAAELRTEISKIWSQIQVVENRLERPPSPAAEPPASERLELDIRSIRDSLQEIREFITRVTAKG